MFLLRQVKSQKSPSNNRSETKGDQELQSYPVPRRDGGKFDRAARTGHARYSSGICRAFSTVRLRMATCMHCRHSVSKELLTRSGKKDWDTNVLQMLGSWDSESPGVSTFPTVIGCTAYMLLDCGAGNEGDLLVMAFSTSSRPSLQYAMKTSGTANLWLQLQCSDIPRAQERKPRGH